MSLNVHSNNTKKIAAEIPEHVLTAISQIEHSGFKQIARELAYSIVKVDSIPASEGTGFPIPQDLPSELISAINHFGVSSLYSHQIEALETLRSGKDLSIATPTASGKTLCFNPAIL